MPVIFLAPLFVLPILSREFWPVDELIVLTRALKQSPWEILTTPVIPHNTWYYRPILIGVTKVVAAVAGLNTEAFRAVQIGLILTLFILLYMTLRAYHVGFMGRAMGCLYALASPFLLDAYWWWSEVNSLIIANCFLAALLVLNRYQDRPGVVAVWGMVLSMVALFSKETGVVIPLLFVLHFAMGRRWPHLVAVLMPVAAYAIFRTVALGSIISDRHFVDASGFMTRFYTPGELEYRFGDYPWVFYAYNVMVSLLTVFTGLAYNGHFVPLMGLIQGMFIPLQLASSLAIAFMLLANRRRLWDYRYLLAAILLNAVVSYGMSRDRLLPVAGLAFAILAAAALEHLHLRVIEARKTLPYLLAAILVIAVLSYPYGKNLDWLLPAGGLTFAILPAAGLTFAILAAVALEHLHLRVIEARKTLALLMVGVFALAAFNVARVHAQTLDARVSQTASTYTDPLADERVDQKLYTDYRALFYPHDVTLVDGKLGNAAQFDGVDDVIQVPYSAALDHGTGEFTWAASVKLNTTDVWQSIFSNYNSQNPYVGLGVSNTNRLTASLRDAAENSVTVTGTTVLSANTWYHVAITRSGATVKLYLNGVLNGSTTTGPTGDTYHDTAMLNFGAGPNNGAQTKFGDRLNGLLEEVQVYNRALTQEEILASIYPS